MLVPGVKNMTSPEAEPCPSQLYACAVDLAFLYPGWVQSGFPWSALDL
jgi:hypothetical protein